MIRQEKFRPFSMLGGAFWNIRRRISKERPEGERVRRKVRGDAPHGAEVIEDSFPIK